MPFNKVKSFILLSKNNSLDLFLFSFFLKTPLFLSVKDTNNFINLKSSFHYKLPKVHLSIKSVECTYYYMFNNPGIYGKVYSLEHVTHFNYSL